MSIYHPTLGGILIGLSSAAMLLGGGRIAGNCGIAGGVIGAAAGDARWRWAWIAGLLGGGLILASIDLGFFARSRSPGPAVVALAGLAVGLGSSIANGCTSGHGICGVARLSVRSLVAVGTFVAAAWLTALLVALRVGG